VRYDLDIAEAIRAVKAYNASPCAQAGEHLLDVAFGDFRKALAPDSVHKQVVLLDSLWGTRLYIERGASDRIASNLATQSGKVIRALESLAKDDLLKRPEHVIQMAQQVLPVVLNQAGDNGQKYRENYSFASKFFHWCTRRHFPIVDGNARRTINRWQQQLGAQPRVRSSTAAMQGLTYVEEYRRWVMFYSDLLYSLGTEDSEQLRRADRDSQVRQYRVENSLLRILDKVFYVQGGGSVQGRTVEA
jgi:hypothetical protein